MRVLIAGASGALGIPLIRALRGHGHEVLGTTRNVERTRMIEELGASALVADAMDFGAIGAAVRQAEPEVVIDLLTALPKAGPMRPADMRLTNETRVKASGNLLDGAIQAGVRRYVAESFYLVYGSGDLGREPLTEDRSVPISVAHPSLTEVISAMVTKEGRALDATKSGQIEGLVLRFGGFYGMGAGLENIVAMLRKRRLPVVDSKNATPWIHIDDAAAAVVLAMEKGRPGGIYNVVDDQPLPMAHFFRTVAQLVGAPQPITVPGFVVKAFAPYMKALLVDSNIRPSNRKARGELGWTPQFANAEAGLRSLLAPHGSTR
jgi:nucleoside-diphosphate-sugar epimerase